MCFKYISCDSIKVLNIYRRIFYIINGNYGKLLVKLFFCGVVNLFD